MAFSAVPPPADLLASSGITTAFTEETQIPDIHFEELLAELDLPKDASFVLPTDLKEQLIIEHTAQFVRREGDRVEFRLKLHDDLISQFPFLHVDHPLHGYYAYLKRTGKTLYSVCPHLLPASLLPFYAVLYEPTKTTQETSTSLPATHKDDADAASSSSTPSPSSLATTRSSNVLTASSSSPPRTNAPLSSLSAAPTTLPSLGQRAEDATATTPPPSADKGGEGSGDALVSPPRGETSRLPVSYTDEGGGLGLLLSAYGDEALSFDDNAPYEDEKDSFFQVPSHEEGELSLPTSSKKRSKINTPPTSKPFSSFSALVSSLSRSFPEGKGASSSRFTMASEVLGEVEQKAPKTKETVVSAALSKDSSPFLEQSPSFLDASPLSTTVPPFQESATTTNASIGSEALQSGVVYIKLDAESKSLVETPKTITIVPICWKAPTPELKISPERSRIIQEIGHCLLQHTLEMISFCFEPCEDESQFFFLKKDTIEERFFKYMVQSIQNFMKSETFAPPPTLTHPLHPTTESYIKHLQKLLFIAQKKKELMERLSNVTQTTSAQSSKTKNTGGDQAVQEERRKRARMVIQSIQKPSSSDP